MKELVNSKTVPDRGDRRSGEETRLGRHFRVRIFSAGRQEGRREVREGRIGRVIVLAEDTTTLVEQPRRTRPVQIDRPQFGSETSRGRWGSCQTGSALGCFDGWSGQHSSIKFWFKIFLIIICDIKLCIFTAYVKIIIMLQNHRKLMKRTVIAMCSLIV